MNQNENDKYHQIKQTIQDIINHTKETKQLDFSNFYYQMENVFKLNGYRDIQNSGVENILVMRLDAIGDFVLTTGFIRELRLNYPSARITLVVSKLVYPLAELCPYANKVLAFDTKTLKGDIVTAIESISEFAAEHFWQEHFSSCFSVQWGSENLPPLLMGYLSGARERIGYGYQIELLHFDKLPPKEQDPNYLLLTKPVINPKNLIHEAEKHLYVLKAIGLPIRSTNMELWYNLKDIQNARFLLNNINPESMKVVVGIGAGGDSRKYPVEQYIRAFKTIIKRGYKVNFVIIGGDAEREDADKIQTALPKESVTNLINKTTLRETEAIIGEADIFIGNDTGVMHMAAALKIPIIAIYRQPKDKDHMVPGVFNEYYRFAPWQSTAIVLRPEHALSDCKDVMVYGGCKYPNAHCIKQIKPDWIVEAFENMNYLLNHMHANSLSHQKS